MILSFDDAIKDGNMLLCNSLRLLDKPRSMLPGCLRSGGISIFLQIFREMFFLQKHF